MSQDRAQDALELGKALDALRQPWDSLYQDITDVFDPGRNQLGRGLSRPTTPDTKEAARLFDSTAARALRTLAQGCSARITPQGAQWGALRPPDNLIRNAAATRWYRECGEILFRYLDISNFYQVSHQHYLDRGAFGTAASECVVGKNNKGLHFRRFQIGEYSIGTDEFDEVDTITRVFHRTPKQLLALYGEKALPQKVKEMVSSATDCMKQLVVRVIIRPRMDRDPRLKDGRNKPWESLHLLVDMNHILHESGFDEFPVACSRWELWGDSPYGWGPSIVALPDASQVNFLEEMLDTQAEISVFPRVLYPSSLKGDIAFQAMGLTCWDPTVGASESMPREWLTGGRYDIGKDRSNDKRRGIEEAMFVPLFNGISRIMNDKSPQTATAIAALVSEHKELFHPIFSGKTREYLIPTVRRSFSLLLRQGAFPEPPRSVLQAGEFDAFIEDPNVQFTSSMALALEQSQLSNFNEAVAVLAPIGQADPSVYDFIDTDAIGPDFFRYKGLPERFIRSPEKIEAIRQGRAQAAQAQAIENASAAVRNLGGAQGLQELSGVIDV